MKKIATIASIAIFAIAVTSCKKEHTCTCKGKLNPLSNNDTTVMFEYGKSKKSDAKETCDFQTTQYQNVDKNAKCEL